MRAANDLLGGISAAPMRQGLHRQINDRILAEVPNATLKRR